MGDQFNNDFVLAREPPWSPLDPSNRDVHTKNAIITSLHSISLRGLSECGDTTASQKHFVPSENFAPLPGLSVIPRGDRDAHTNNTIITGLHPISPEYNWSASESSFLQDLNMDYPLDHISQGSECEDIIASQKHFVPSANFAPLPGLGVIPRGNNLVEIGDKMFCIEETQSRYWLAEQGEETQSQYWIAEQGNSPTGTDDEMHSIEETQSVGGLSEQYTIEPASLGYYNYFGYPVLEAQTPSLSHTDTASTSSFQEDGFVGSEMIEKNISPPVLLNTSKKTNKKTKKQNSPRLKKTTGTGITKRRKTRICEMCQEEISESEYRKHQQSHLRSFVCSFAFAGCDQSFGSKNEWKRHIYTKHMCLCYWRCSECDQCDQQAFNRRDLIGQHLRRMHGPHPKKLNRTASEQREHDIWLQTVPIIQDNCFHELRNPPTECSCEICGDKFQGSGAFEAKLHHVGKHYEDNDPPATGGPFKDLELIKWALKHKIIEIRSPMEDMLAENSSTLPPQAMHNTFAVNLSTYQLARESPFFPDPDLRSEGHNEDQEDIREPSSPYSDFIFPDGAYEDAPNENDTTILFSNQ